MLVCNIKLFRDREIYIYTHLYKFVCGVLHTGKAAYIWARRFSGRLTHTHIYTHMETDSQEHSIKDRM